MSSEDKPDPIKMLHNIEQGSKLMVDNCPGLWWGLYEGCCEKGFTDQQAFTLVLTFIHTMFGSSKG